MLIRLEKDSKRFEMTGIPIILDPRSGTPIPERGVADLCSDNANATSDHYAKQWGDETGYTKFIRQSEDAARFTMARQLGWPALFERIRAASQSSPTSVYDAACGFGLIFRDLFAEPTPTGLSYVGADIHTELASIPNDHGNARFVRFDVSEPLPTPERFDFVVCRAAIHHTPDPEHTFRSLTSVLKPGGTIAISAYVKKAPMREAVDTALRNSIIPLSSDEAFQLVRQCTLLGRDLQRSEGSIEIVQDLPFLRIPAGRYKIQEFIYDFLMKCWFNDEFGEQWSDIVNFDWYHPPFAYRYDLDELAAWYERSGVTLVKTESNKAQHYLEGKLLG